MFPRIGKPRKGQPAPWPAETQKHSIATLSHRLGGNLFPTLRALQKPMSECSFWEEKTMTAFTRHPYKQGITYVGHWFFAMGIAARLLASVLAFVLHAMLPFIPIERRLDLEATSAFLLERNHFIQTAAATAHGRPLPGRSFFESRPA